MIDFADPMFKGVGPLILRIVTDTSRKWKIESEELLSEAMICFFKYVAPAHKENKGALTTLTYLSLSRHLNRYCKQQSNKKAMNVLKDIGVYERKADSAADFPDGFVQELQKRRKNTPITLTWAAKRLRSYGWSDDRTLKELDTLFYTYEPDRREFSVVTEEA